MLPRRSTATKLATLGGLLLVCFWVWMGNGGNQSSNVDASEVLLILEPPDSSTKSQLTRSNTKMTKDSANLSSPIQTHHHSNQTLNQMMKNMTLLKANKTILQNIINKVNQSRSQVLHHDEKHYANPHPFKYILNSPNICKNKDIFMVSYIHTAPSHYKRRMVIRQTWGNPKHYPDTKIRVIFVMGKTFDKPEVQQALAFESEQYGDIVQEDFMDTYKNLTYKGVAGLKWISDHCSHAKFVLKTDDDIFVNTFTLLRHLQSLYKMGVNDKGLIMCLVWYKMTVMRTGKWKISKDEFKDDYYPTYCSGSAFTMSMDVAVAMHNVSYHVPFFWVDDFYITGLLPLKLGLKHKQFMSTYVLDGRKLEDKFTGSQWFTYIFSHVHNLNIIQSVWDRLVQLNNGAPGPKVKFALPGQLPDEKELRRKEAEEQKKKEEERKKKAVAASKAEFAKKS